MSSRHQTVNFRANAAPASSSCARQTAKKTKNKKVQHGPNPGIGHFQPLQLSSLNLVDASPYSRRHTSRLIVTTIDAITTVAASRTRKLPLSVA